MKKKLLSIFLVSNIIFFQISGAYINAYASAADVIVNGLMSEGAAMSTLMTMFGISPSAAALAAAGGVSIWGLQQVEKYKRYMGAQSEYESEDVANQAAADLVDGVAHGLLNTSTSAYRNFRKWLGNMQGDGAFTSSGGTYTVVPPNTEFITFEGSSPLKSETQFNCFACKTSGIGTNDSWHIYYFKNDTVEISPYFTRFSNLPGTDVYFNSSTYARDDLVFNENLVIYSDPISVTSPIPWEQDYEALRYVLGLPVPSTGDYSLPNDLLSGLGDRDKTLEDLEQQGISANGAIGTTGTGSRTVDINNVLDKSGASTMDKVLEKVYNGELSWSDFMDAMGVATTVNTATGTQALVVDNTNTATFEKAEEYEADQEFRPPVADIVVPPSYDDSDFTINNLEEIFPFCIPFDLYDFISALAAEPQAPHWRLKASFIGRDDLYLEIDLRSWDKVAEYCRDFELLLYIVGLILVTRNLIRG